MKKITLIIAASLTLNCCLLAQKKIAITGGLNYGTARVYYSDERETFNTKQPSSYKPGFGLGIVLDCPFDGPLHFMPSFLYNVRGYKYSPLAGDTATFDNTIHYFDVVPALALKLARTGKASIYVSAGPHIGFAITGKEKITRKSGVTDSHNMTFSFNGEYGIFDLGVAGGLGINVKRYIIEAGYMLGFANINNNVDLDYRNIRNRTFTLRFGYIIK